VAGTHTTNIFWHIIPYGKPCTILWGCLRNTSLKEWPHLPFLAWTGFNVYLQGCWPLNTTQHSIPKAKQGVHFGARAHNMDMEDRSNACLQTTSSCVRQHQLDSVIGGNALVCADRRFALVAFKWMDCPACPIRAVPCDVGFDTALPVSWNTSSN
jgi:hypothetical protein